MAQSNITPGGILDGLNFPLGDSSNFLLRQGPPLIDIPWTVREGGIQQPAMPVFEDLVSPAAEDLVPLAPPGISVGENIVRAEQFKSPWWKPGKLAKYELMTELFPSGHEMDYKKIDPKYRDFGNFNFGTFGSALGLSPYELHSGAGYQQFRDNNWEIGYGIPGLVPPYGDNDMTTNRSMPVSPIIRRIVPRSSAVILLLAVPLSGCGERVKGEIVQELPRPGYGVTAILTKDSGHWVTSHVYYDVYLKADKDGVVDHVFSARDMNTAAKMRWQSPNVLMISMTCGEIGIYRNFSWYRPEPKRVFIGIEGNQACKPDVPVAPIPRVRNNELVLPK